MIDKFDFDGLTLVLPSGLPRLVPLRRHQPTMSAPPSGLSAESIRTGVAQAQLTGGILKTLGAPGVSGLLIDKGAWGKLSPQKQQEYLRAVRKAGGFIQVVAGLADAARKRAEEAAEEARKRIQAQ